MLILTRRTGESIIITIGEVSIVVAVLGVKGNQARIGIEAPRDVIVDREEIHNAKLMDKTNGENAQ